MNMGELEMLPPFRADQVLSNDELLDIILYGTPKGWQKEMDRQGCRTPVDSNNCEVNSMLQRGALPSETDSFQPFFG